jgi:hypothetical protein
MCFLVLKPRTYRAGGFDLCGDFSVKLPKHESIKCYAVVSGQCWLSVEKIGQGGDELVSGADEGGSGDFRGFRGRVFEDVRLLFLPFVC